jgi:hypothetical protein
MQAPTALVAVMAAVEAVSSAPLDEVWINAQGGDRCGATK